MEIIKLNNENFISEVKESNQVVLVDFYADWCGPCKMMSPIVDKIAEEIGGQAKICKLNVDEAQDIAFEYNVMSIPTLIIFKNGSVVQTLVGLQDKETLLNSIKQAL
ncbi:MAG: thioredoxin [Clostridia bacterium]|nr:thioredoxin [Clostridia bacterium]